MENLGYKIKVLRKKSKITQTQLSCDILSRSSISKIETGKLMPSLAQLEHIAYILNIPLSDLLNNSGSKIKDEIKGYNTKHISSLYENKKYLDIVESIKPYDFITYYFVGMSYYRLDLKKDSEKYLKFCEKMFNSLSEDEKCENVERLCYALNCLRTIKIQGYGDPLNKEYLDKALKYLKIHGSSGCEIYYIINSNMTTYLISNKMYEETIAFIENFLRENQKINSFTILPHIHLNLSIAYFACKNYTKSIEAINKAIFFFNYTGDIFEEGECYLNLFNSYLYNNQYDLCYNLLEILPLKFMDNSLEEMYKVLELVLLYNVNDIESILSKSKLINIRRLRNKTRIDYYFILGRANFLSEKYTVALNCYKKCINYLEKTEKYLDLSLIYKDIYFITNDNNAEKKYTYYKELYNKSVYNSIHPNLTSPNYFL